MIIQLDNRIVKIDDFVEGENCQKYQMENGSLIIYFESNSAKSFVLTLNNYATMSGKIEWPDCLVVRELRFHEHLVSIESLDDARSLVMNDDQDQTFKFTIQGYKPVYVVFSGPDKHGFRSVCFLDKSFAKDPYSVLPLESEDGIDKKLFAKKIFSGVYFGELDSNHKKIGVGFDMTTSNCSGDYEFLFYIPTAQDSHSRLSKLTFENQKIRKMTGYYVTDHSGSVLITSCESLSKKRFTIKPEKAVDAFRVWCLNEELSEDESDLLYSKKNLYNVESINEGQIYEIGMSDYSFDTDTDTSTIERKVELFLDDL